MSPQNQFGDESPEEGRIASRHSDQVAAERAERIAHGREAPHVPTPEQLTRPQTVLIGCGMTWIGVLTFLYGAWRALSVDEDSALMDNVKEADLQDQLAVVHAIGQLWVFWSLLLLLFSLAAFFGRRWGGTSLLVMAALFMLGAVLSLFTGFAMEGVVTAIWSVSAATLIRLREPSRDWYANLRLARDASG